MLKATMIAVEACFMKSINVVQYLMFQMCTSSSTLTNLARTVIRLFFYIFFIMGCWLVAHEPWNIEVLLVVCMVLLLASLIALSL